MLSRFGILWVARIRRLVTSSEMIIKRFRVFTKPSKSALVSYGSVVLFSAREYFSHDVMSAVKLTEAQLDLLLCRRRNLLYAFSKEEKARNVRFSKEEKARNVHF